jgi:hypothetical protein
MKNFIKSICIGLLFLPLISSQKSIAESNIAEPTVICCLENSWKKCAVVVYFDSDGNQVNFNVANGIEVRCPSYL